MSRRAGLLLALAAAGCAPSPEALVRQVLRTAEQAAEAGRIDDLAAAISSGCEGRDELVRLAADYVERHRPLHLLVIERSLRSEPHGTMVVEALVAAAATPLQQLRDASAANADVAAVTLEFARETDGRWRVIRAEWRPVL